MPKASTAYANMKATLLAEVSRIPAGNITEASALGEALNIPARYVGSILGSLKHDELKLVPWHRVVFKNTFDHKEARMNARSVLQRELLMSEGHLGNGGLLFSMDASRLWKPDRSHAHTFWAEESPASKHL